MAGGWQIFWFYMMWVLRRYVNKLSAPSVVETFMGF